MQLRRRRRRREKSGEGIVVVVVVVEGSGRPEINIIHFPPSSREEKKGGGGETPFSFCLLCHGPNSRMGKRERGRGTNEKKPTLKNTRSDTKGERRFFLMKRGGRRERRKGLVD